MWKIIVCFCVFSPEICLLVKSSRDIPSGLKTCSRDDIDVDDCLKKNIQAAMAVVTNGIPEIGLKPLDPYRQKELFVEYKRNQISGRAGLLDLVAYGIGKSKILAVRSNFLDESMELEIDFTDKKLTVEGLMTGEGRLNALVLRAKGLFNNTMHDLDWTLKMAGKLEIRNGEGYMRIVKFRMRPEIRDMDVHIPDISNNADLNRFAKYFANRFWPVVYAELLTVIEHVWEKIGISYCNKIFTKIPYNKIFPISND